MTADAGIQTRRTAVLGANMPTFYDDPLHIIRGEGVWLWSADGTKFLDCYNNVPHVGHCHPRVVQAITQQAGMLNTHTRYTHEGILDYVEALTGKFATDLNSAIMVCSGSEANDVALRMAQVATGHSGIIATDLGYHGNTALVSQLGLGKQPVGERDDRFCHVAAPDTLRPAMSLDGHAAHFTRLVEAAIADLQAKGHGVAALVLCPFLANEGFPTLPPQMLVGAIATVRKAGGLVIADEVQPGFGRIGSHWWGHEKADFTPEIVTVGKPMGNGHPVAAVIANVDLISDFRRAFKYFNTFGGNPVSCAAASAVLKIIEEENLVANALEVGAYAMARLKELKGKFSQIGDVRGSGLFFGIEMVGDAGLDPDTALAADLVEAMKARGVLLHTVGDPANTLKIRPPMVFSKANADQLVETFERALGDTLAAR